MPAGELHIQLSVNFPDNRKVRALIRYGREARPARERITLVTKSAASATMGTSNRKNCWPLVSAKPRKGISFWEANEKLPKAGAGKSRPCGPPVRPVAFLKIYCPMNTRDSETMPI